VSAGQPDNVVGSATPFVRGQTQSQVGPVTVLGTFPTAIYLEFPSGAVIAVQTSNAVALPIGVVLPHSHRSPGSAGRQ
jgi:hypothetical protein